MERREQSKKREIRYEETQEEEFGVNINSVLENRRSKMSTKPMKPVSQKPGDVESPRAANVTKQTMIDAIVNVEKGVEELHNKLTGLDDAFRQYIDFQGSGKEFQLHLNKTEEARKKDFAKQQEKAMKDLKQKGLLDKNGKPIIKKSK